jgi:molecular chaperone DnaJ
VAIAFTIVSSGRRWFGWLGRLAVKRDYYEVLGVSRDASSDELKRAFRKLAMDLHPDRNPNNPEAEARFKAAAEAYQVLSDPDRRRSYDLFGHTAVGPDAGFGGFEGFGFADIFDAFFGSGFGSRTQSRTVRGTDLRYDLTINFEEAFHGAQRDIEVPRMASCERCRGNGAEPGSPIDTCGTCGGSGQVRRAAQSIFGQVVNVSSCPSCRGEGRRIRQPCVACRGAGRMETLKKLKLRIPAGVDTGSQIRLTGEGESGIRGGPPGDLYVVIRVKHHPQLVRRDQDVVYELKLNMIQAALGDRIEVPTLEAPVEVAIPAGTQHGQTFRLAGKGMPHVRTGRRGDQYVVVQVVVPKDLNAKQKELLRQVGGLTGKPEKVSKGFFDKLKDAINLD